MRVKSISFENYKAFAKRQTIKLKPITILLGKNSSGKSSIAKLFTLLENSLSSEIDEPLHVKNYGVELGAEYRDLAFGRNSSPIAFEIELTNGSKLGIKIVQEKLEYKLQIVEWALNDFRLQYSPDGGFVDREEKAYELYFKGFIPYLRKDGEGQADFFKADLDDFKLDVDYVGPFRFLPPRQFNLSGQINFKKIGIKGDKAYEILGVSKKLGSELLSKVGKWFKDHFEGWELVVDSDEDRSVRPYFQVLLRKNQIRLESEGTKFLDEISINIVDVGQGMNQVLPLIVRANIGRPDSIIVIEQPELHLHPAAHGDLAELFARSAKENDQIFVIETHSENILLRLRKLIVENNFGFQADDLIIYWIDDSAGDGQDAVEITVDDEGVLSDWKEGVFNENVREILAMQNALKKKNS